MSLTTHWQSHMFMLLELIPCRCSAGWFFFYMIACILVPKHTKVIAWWDMNNLSFRFTVNEKHPHIQSYTWNHKNSVAHTHSQHVAATKDPVTCWAHTYHQSDVSLFIPTSDCSPIHQKLRSWRPLCQTAWRLSFTLRRLFHLAADIQYGTTEIRASSAY